MKFKFSLEFLLQFQVFIAAGLGCLLFNWHLHFSRKYLISSLVDSFFWDFIELIKFDWHFVTGAISCVIDTNLSSYANFKFPINTIINVINI